MEKTVVWLHILILFTSRFLATFSQDIVDTSDWLSVDCGNDDPLAVISSRLDWVADDGFTNTGTNQKVLKSQPDHQEMNTLRSFPHQSQPNCYTLPVIPQTIRYLVRAGFYYGNYDNLNKPPKFDLLIDDKKWSTVDTSASAGGPMYEELMYVTRGSGNVKLCLAQIKDGGVPVISSIEIVPTGQNLYLTMEENRDYSLVTRTYFGFNHGDIGYTGLISQEKYNRIWKWGATPVNCIETPLGVGFTTPENDPPVDVYTNGVVARDTFDTITLLVNFTETTNPQSSAYFVLYLAPEEQLFSQNVSTIQIIIDGQIQDTVTLGGDLTVLSFYPLTVPGPTSTIKLVPTNSSTLPPSISAVEVFTRADLAGESSSSDHPSTRHFSAYFVLMYCLCYSIFLLF